MHSLLNYGRPGSSLLRGFSLDAVRGGPSPVAEHGLLKVWSQVSRPMGSVVVVHRLSCPVASGIFPDQESNPCPLH